MKATDWNRLAHGDEVFVHATGARSYVTEKGSVRFVEVGIERGANSLGIRLQCREHVTLWPKPEAVHRHAVAPVGTCWRCDGIAPVPARTRPSDTSSAKADHHA